MADVDKCDASLVPYPGLLETGRLTLESSALLIFYELFEEYKVLDRVLDYETTCVDKSFLGSWCQSFHYAPQA